MGDLVGPVKNQVWDPILLVWVNEVQPTGGGGGGTVTQGTTPWVIAGSVTQGTSPWTVAGTVNQGTPGSSPWLVSGSVNQGSAGSTPWLVSGSVTQGTSPWTVAGTVNQGTPGGSPWLVSGSVNQGSAGSTPWLMTGTVNQGTPGSNPWLVSGSVNQGTPGSSPWLVTGSVTQGTTPWTVGYPPLTPGPPLTVSVGTTSSQILAANPNRRGLIIISLAYRAFIALSFGNYAASAIAGISLGPRGVWAMDPMSFTTAAVNAVATEATAVAIQEFSA